MIHNIDQAVGRLITTEEGEFTYFGGTAYLGLQTLATFGNLYINNIKKYGVNHGASRQSNIRYSVYEQAESLVSEITGSEACISLSSGFLAGQLISNFYQEASFSCFYAPRTHIALHQNNSRNLKNFPELQEAINTSQKTPVLFCDSIDFYGENYPDFRWLDTLDCSKIIMVIDDSHGLGIIGNNGEGILSQLRKYTFKDLVVTSSMSKGYGIQAGVILGSANLINSLRASNWYAASSPCPPAAMATFIEAQELYKQQLKRLGTNIAYFNLELKNASKFIHLKGHPTYSYNDTELTQHFYDNKLIVTNFKYPNDAEGATSRIVLSAHHMRSDIDKLVLAINNSALKQKKPE
jgi:7-keto-8-aminopelargonate synthetase-like enzyme